MTQRRAFDSTLVILAILLPMLLPAENAHSQGSFKDFKSQQAAELEAHNKKVLREFADFKAEFEAYKEIIAEERARIRGEVGERWDDPELSSEKVWVEYSDDLDERRSVDFENETITIEVTAAEDEGVSAEALRSALTDMVTKNKAQAFEDDALAQAVERRSKAELPSAESAEVPTDPILLPYLTGLGADLLAVAEAASDYVVEIVDHMIAEADTSTTTNSRGEKVVKIEVPLGTPTSVADSAARIRAETSKEPGASDAAPAKLPSRAAAIWGHVDQFSKKSKVEPALVYAVIETESAFDPMATSHIPAYGLMQIVPGSAGVDVAERLFKEKKLLTPSYLYVAGNNVMVGARYLQILLYEYLKSIKNPESRLYCAIAAYNTGAGNVARAFTGKTATGPAAAKINKMKPKDVYDHLVANLPHDETRKYVEKVTRLKAKYDGYGI